MAATFQRIGNAYFRQDESGQLYAVSDKDTLKGLQSGQLPYTSRGDTTGLRFGTDTSQIKPLNFGTQLPAPSPTNVSSTAPQGVSGVTGASGGAPQDAKTTFQQALQKAMANMSGVTNTSELEAKRQNLLRQSLLAPTYAPTTDNAMTPDQNLSLLRQRGSQYEPELKALETEIAAAREGDNNAFDRITAIANAAKAVGVDLGEGAGGYESPMGKEYSDYVNDQKSRGESFLTFNEYATLDANRKRAITTATESGMSSKEVTVFNGIVDKYNKSPLVAANDRVSILRTMTEQLGKDKRNSALQVSFIYSLIQALDTYQSAVREGEIAVVGSTQGVADQIANLPDKIAKGSILSESVIDRYIGVANTLAGSIQTAADKKKTTFGAQARVAGVGDAWDDYAAAIGSPSEASAPASTAGKETTKVVNGVTMVFKDNGDGTSTRIK